MTTIDISNEPIFFAIYDQFGNVYDISEDLNIILYYVSINTDKITRELTTNIRLVETEKCNINEISLKYSDVINIDINLLSRFICIRPNQNITITGHIGLENFTYLTIYLQKTKNFNQTKLQSLIYEQRLILFYLDFIIDHENYKSPLNRALRAEDFKFLYNETHNFIYEISDSFYETQNYLIGSKSKKSKFFQYYKKSLNSITFNKNNTLSIDIKHSGYLNTYIRKYLKIDEVISKLAGLCNCAYIIINFIGTPIINKVFTIEKINILMFKAQKDYNQIENKDSFDFSNFNSKNHLKIIHKENINKSLYNFNLKTLSEMKKYYSISKKSKTEKKLSIYFDINNFKYIRNKINKINPSILFYILPQNFLCSKKNKSLTENYNIYLEYLYYILSFENLYELIVNIQKTNNEIISEKEEKLN